MILVPRKASAPERMDDPRIEIADLHEALRGLVWTNRRLGGARALLEAIEPHFAAIPGSRTIEVLDVGTGAGDLPLALVALGKGLGRRVAVTAIDRSPAVAAFAARSVGSEPAVRVACADARRLPFAPRSFDLVTASLFLHHFEHRDVTQLLAAFRGLARHAVLVSDLRRHVVPWLFIALTARLLRLGETYTFDAPLSVRRGFTRGELADAARASGARGPRIRRRFPYRIVLEIDAGAEA